MVGQEGDGDGASGRTASDLPLEIDRLHEREVRYMALLQDSQRRAERSRAFMMALGALSSSDTLFRDGLERALSEILATSRRELGVARAGVWLFDDERTYIEN